MGRERTALPPLYGKEVEITHIIPLNLSVIAGFNRYGINLIINGLRYTVIRTAKDELEILRWLMDLQAKKPTGQP